MNSKKFILKIVSASLIVVAFLVSVGFVSHQQANMPCSGVSIIITDSVYSGFIETSDIEQIIQNKFGSLQGQSIASINISLLEKIINNNPFIYDAEVFSTVDGKVNIEVKQRIPVLRIINHKNESFYIDRDGVFMPPSEKFAARVPVANGFIFDSEAQKKVRNTVSNDSVASRSKIEQLYNIAVYTGKNDFWNAEAQQFYVNANGDIEMIPRLGSHSVIIGDDSDLDIKFRKLYAFYKEGLNKSGWNKYSSINLKYKNQVVCTKK